MLNLTCLSTYKTHLQHLAESNVKILGKSKNLNKTEISLNIGLIRYYVVFLVSFLTALGIGGSVVCFTVIMLNCTCAGS